MQCSTEELVWEQVVLLNLLQLKEKLEEKQNYPNNKQIWNRKSKFFLKILVSVKLSERNFKVSDTNRR